MSVNLLTILAQAETAAPQGGMLQQLMASPLMIIVPFFLLFYFMIIRPQGQQKKEHAKRITALKKGDKIITNGGIHGLVNHKSEKTCSVRVSDGVFITMELANISTVLPKGSASSDEAKVEEK